MVSTQELATLPRMKPGRRSTIHNILDMQKALYLDATSDETTAAARAQVARAYKDLEELKRLLRGKPNLKPVDVGSLRSKPKSSPKSAFTEAESGDAPA